MFTIKLAEHIFNIENKYDYVRELCRDYCVDYQNGIKIKVTDNEIEDENVCGDAFDLDYLESLAIYRKICDFLLQEDIILFHSSAVLLDENAYLFTAPSGTGKSTHAQLWRQKFGNRLKIINDDKPLLKVGKDKIVVYGTPYAGKHSIQTNTSANVKGIIILNQAESNSIKQLTSKKAFVSLYTQTYQKKHISVEEKIKTIELITYLSKLPVFYLNCTISEEAVELAYNSFKEIN